MISLLASAPIHTVTSEVETFIPSQFVAVYEVTSTSTSGIIEPSSSLVTMADANNDLSTHTLSPSTASSGQHDVHFWGTPSHQAQLHSAAATSTRSRSRTPPTTKLPSSEEMAIDSVFQNIITSPQRLHNNARGLTSLSSAYNTVTPSAAQESSGQNVNVNNLIDQWKLSHHITDLQGQEERGSSGVTSSHTSATIFKQLKSSPEIPAVVGTAQQIHPNQSSMPKKDFIIRSQSSDRLHRRITPLPNILPSSYAHATAAQLHGSAEHGHYNFHLLQDHHHSQHRHGTASSSTSSDNSKLNSKASTSNTTTGSAPNMTSPQIQQRATTTSFKSTPGGLGAINEMSLDGYLNKNDNAAAASNMRRTVSYSDILLQSILLGQPSGGVSPVVTFSQQQQHARQEALANEMYSALGNGSAATTTRQAHVQGWHSAPTTAVSSWAAHDIPDTFNHGFTFPSLPGAGQTRSLNFVDSSVQSLSSSGLYNSVDSLHQMLNARPGGSSRTVAQQPLALASTVSMPETAAAMMFDRVDSDFLNSAIEKIIQDIEDTTTNTGITDVHSYQVQSAPVTAKQVHAELQSSTRTAMPNYAGHSGDLGGEHPVFVPQRPHSALGSPPTSARGSIRGTHICFNLCSTIKCNDSIDCQSITETIIQYIH